MTQEVSRTDAGITGNPAAVDRLRELEAEAARRTGTAFADLLNEGVDVLTGRQVADKELLLGVPFVITSARFNDGAAGRDFVSLEITTRDDQALVINDSGTGIRRQVVNYLAAKGLIELAAGPVKVLKDELPPEDAPYSSWVRGSEFAHEAGFPVRWVILHGLRVSEYTNEYGDARTFYLA